MTSESRIAAALLAACLALPAAAGLGERATVPSSSATVTQGITASGVAFTRVQRTLDSGTVVHEFADAGGTVFAVAWSGPFLPDLRDLLGPSFTAFAQAGSARGRASTLELQGPDLVLVSSGRMGAFAGRAWLPARLPAGFDTRLVP